VNRDARAAEVGRHGIVRRAVTGGGAYGIFGTSVTGRRHPASSSRRSVLGIDDPVAKRTVGVDG